MLDDLTGTREEVTEKLKAFGLTDEQIQEMTFTESTEAAHSPVETPEVTETIETTQTDSEVPPEGTELPVDKKAALKELFGDSILEDEPVPVVAPDTDTASKKAALAYQKQQVEYEQQKLQLEHPNNHIEMKDYHSHNGKSVYEMNQQELQTYSQLLRDESRLEELSLVNTDLNAYRKSYQTWVSKATLAYQTQQAIEWDEIGLSLVEKIPELSGDIPAVRKWLEEKLKDPAAQKLASIKEGKVKLIGESIKALQLHKKLEPDTPQVQTPAQPPDSALKGKRVDGNGSKRTYTRAEINKMSLVEYRTLEADIDAAQYDGRIVD